MIAFGFVSGCLWGVGGGWVFGFGVSVLLFVRCCCYEVIAGACCGFDV